MIYVTGDIHADLDRFKGKEAKKLKKGDTLIVCGDFGFVWDGSKKEQQVLKWIGKRPYQVLFIEGTTTFPCSIHIRPSISAVGAPGRSAAAATICCAGRFIPLKAIRFLHSAAGRALTPIRA